MRLGKKEAKEEYERFFVTTQPSKRLYVGEIRLYAPYVVAR
jgi:hypothetical protein